MCQLLWLVFIKATGLLDPPQLILLGRRLPSLSLWCNAGPLRGLYDSLPNPEALTTRLDALNARSRLYPHVDAARHSWF